VLDDLERDISTAKSKLESESEEFDDVMKDLERNMERLERENASIISQYQLGVFWELKSLWQSADYMKQDMVNKLNEYETDNIINDHRFNRRFIS